jgi:hypothetical protein
MKTAIARKLPRTLLTATLALAATFAGFAATVEPAHAATRGGAYAVTLTSPVSAPRREIVDGVLWRCEGERCSAPADGERTLALCGKVARKFGALAAFTGPQGALSTEDLARCNSAAPVSRSAGASAVPLQALLP